MTGIYDQHDAAFKSVSAYVILKDGERVATVAIKFPKDGAGRLYAYVHWLGKEMVRGFAGGYGYDKRSAAVADAVDRMCGNGEPDGECECGAAQNAFMTAARKNTGRDWSDCVRDAGFTVLQAV